MADALAKSVEIAKLRNFSEADCAKITIRTNPMAVEDIHALQSAAQSSLEFCPIHCPNGHLGRDLGFGGFAFSLKFHELLNTNLVTVSAKFGQTSSCPNGPKFGFQ